MPKRLDDIAETCWYSGSWLSVLLLPFSWVFAGITLVRRFLYDKNILPRPQLPVPVIVVGNISVGGTGKTPVVAWLAKQLAAQGYRPGIVSRGYGGSYQGPPRLVVADDDPAVVGDEPLMLVQQTGLPVCIAADRVAAVQAIAAQDVNVVIADDGLQHYRLRRVVEWVVVDGERALGNGRLLPAGPLRESAQRLKHVDAVLLNGNNSGLNGVAFNLEGADIVSINDGGRRSLSAFSGARVWALAGIGNPQRFYRRLEKAGLVLDLVPVSDHGVLDLHKLIGEREQPILMTEKDAVKYQRNPPAGVWFLQVEAVFEPAEAANLLQSVTARLS
jgi:tetraacyldisaccharide 4'-kinase